MPVLLLLMLLLLLQLLLLLIFVDSVVAVDVAVAFFRDERWPFTL